MRVLVTGATGNVGSNVVRELRGRDVTVRAFVRDPARAADRLGRDVELAVGDFEEPESIARALEGVERVFLSSADSPHKPTHEAAVIDAAAAAGVELIVKASTMFADPGSPLPPLAWNGQSEEHLRRSGVPWTIVASSFYMTNLLMAAEQVRQTRRLFAPAGEGGIAMIDPADSAAVGAIALTGDGHSGRAHRVTGPEAITYARIAEELSEATGATVEYVDVPPEAARQQLAAAGLPDWLVEHLDRAFALVREGRMAETTDSFRELTGRAPRSFRDFARDHAPLFESAGGAPAPP